MGKPTWVLEEPELFSSWVGQGQGHSNRGTSTLLCSRLIGSTQWSDESVTNSKEPPARAYVRSLLPRGVLTTARGYICDHMLWATGLDCGVARTGGLVCSGDCGLNIAPQATGPHLNSVT